jgi:hypothetical protein
MESRCPPTKKDGDNSRLWNVFGRISTVLDNGDLLIGTSQDPVHGRSAYPSVTVMVLAGSRLFDSSITGESENPLTSTVIDDSPVRASTRRTFCTASIYLELLSRQELSIGARMKRGRRPIAPWAIRHRWRGSRPLQRSPSPQVPR